MAAKPSKDCTISPAISSGLGALAGVIEVALQQPHVAWKNAVQDNRPVPWTRPAQLYRGALVNAGSMAPINAIQFGVDKLLSEALLASGRKVSDAGKVGVAASAGAVSALVGCPAELIMIQQQKQGGSLASQLRQVVQQHGVTAFAKGLGPTVIRESIYTGTYLGANPLICSKLQQLQPGMFADRPVAAMVVASIVSGLAAAGLTQPVDAIKTKLQANLGDPAYSSVTRAAASMIKERGVLSLWSGLLPRSLRIIGAVFILGEAKKRLEAGYLSLTATQDVATLKAPL
eukprot:TRINITY_DN9308_c0_g1_i1.p1 TRINITY_DN9308_c0_g1~~TRINITY_DN9308_c0_g1_i1.p1  ORF type:complete len:288 (-),score=15.19 TRINITY_DN9308_c0_g1_i1:390-1253(-)